MSVTEAFQWVEARLDDGGWIRRAYLVVATYMLWRVSEWAMAFSTLPGAVRFTGTDIAAITVAVSGPACIVAKFAFEAYLESRKKPASTIMSVESSSSVETTK